MFRFRVLWMLLVILLTAGCGSEPPEAVVARMYNAINEGDSDAYLDTLLPSTRKRPDLGGIILSLAAGMSLSAGPVGFDIGGMLVPKTGDMQFRVMSQDGDYAVVEARGLVRMMMMEFKFCDTHDVIRVGGRWYVDATHPARVQRVSRYSDRNAKTLQAQGYSIQNPEDPLADPLAWLDQLFMLYGTAMEIVTDLCD